MSKHAAREFGMQLAKAITEESLRVEANAIPTGIHPHPVRLAPLFRPIDPLQTWTDRAITRAVPGTVKDSWVARRILIPPTETNVAAGVALAGLAGCDGPLSFEGIITKDALRLSRARRSTRSSTRPQRGG